MFELIPARMDGRYRCLGFEARVAIDHALLRRCRCGSFLSLVCNASCDIDVIFCWVTYKVDRVSTNAALMFGKPTAKLRI